MTFSHKERATLMAIANKIEVQADCLEGYAEQAGFTAKPVPSVFHSQAMHFRDYAKELQEVIGGKA